MSSSLRSHRLSRCGWWGLGPGLLWARASLPLRVSYGAEPEPYCARLVRFEVDSGSDEPQSSVQQLQARLLDLVQSSFPVTAASPKGPKVYHTQGASLFTYASSFELKYCLDTIFPRRVRKSRQASPDKAGAQDCLLRPLSLDSCIELLPSYR